MVTWLSRELSGIVYLDELAYACQTLRTSVSAIGAVRGNAKVVMANVKNIKAESYADGYHFAQSRS